MVGNCVGCETFQIIVLLFLCNKQCNLFKSRNLLANLLLPFLVPYVDEHICNVSASPTLFTVENIQSYSCVSEHVKTR